MVWLSLVAAAEKINTVGSAIRSSSAVKVILAQSSSLARVVTSLSDTNDKSVKVGSVLSYVTVPLVISAFVSALRLPAKSYILIAI